MKTQIIQLEPHDDVVSTRDKMGWSQTSRILLVWPDKGRILYRRLDLIILARHSRSLGSQLALVTGDAEVRYNADQVGIPVFNALRQAQDAHWRLPFYRKSRYLRRIPPLNREALREKPDQKQAGWREPRIIYWIAFTSSVLALLALVIVLLPGASISLAPQTQVQEVTLPVMANEKIATLNLAGSLPAHWTSIVVEGRSAISTTGTVQVPVAPASGTIQFINLTESSVTIPVGTLVSTLGSDPIWYATTKEGKVASGIGKTTFIPIQAVQPGESGNLPAGMIQAINGPLGLQLSVINLAPILHGVDKSAPAPNSDDRSRLYNRLLASLSQTAMQELQKRYVDPPIKSGIPILPSLRFSSVIEKIYDPTENFPAEQLQLSLRLEFRALEIYPQDLQNLVTPLLDASLPEDHTVIPDTLNITSLNKPILDEENTARWTLRAQRQIQAVIAPEKAIQLAKGTTIEKARQSLLDHLPVDKTPLIRPFPSWWPYTPFLPFRMDVQIEK